MKDIKQIKIKRSWKNGKVIAFNPETGKVIATANAIGDRDINGKVEKGIITLCQEQGITDYRIHIIKRKPKKSNWFNKLLGNG